MSFKFWFNSSVLVIIGLSLPVSGMAQATTLFNLEGDGKFPNIPNGIPNVAAIPWSGIISSGTLLVNGPSMIKILDNSSDIMGAVNRINDGVHGILQHAMLNTEGYKEMLGTLTLQNRTTVDMALSKEVTYLDSADSPTLPITHPLDTKEAVGFGTTTSGLRANQLSQTTLGNPYETGSVLMMGSIIESVAVQIPKFSSQRPKPVPELNTLLAFAILGAGAAWKKSKALIAVYQALQSKHKL